MRLRELAVPLQALVAMLVCIGLAWMVYAMAFFDPNPPTAAEVHLLGTQNPESQVLRTAAAMTVESMLFGPTQILMPVTGPSLTPTLISTLTRPPFSTLAAIPTATGTITRRPVMTPTSRDGENPNLPPAATSTATPRPTSTNVPTTEPPPTITTEPPTVAPTATDAPTEPPIDTPTDDPPTEPPVDTPTDDPPTEPPPVDTPTEPTL